MKTFTIELTITARVILTVFVLMILAFALIVLGLFDFTNKLHIYVVLFIILSSTFLLIYRGKKQLDPFSPLFGLTILLFLYSFSSALFVEVNQANFAGDSISTDTLLIYYISCLVALVGLNGGALMAKYSNFGWCAVTKYDLFSRSKDTFYNKAITYAVLFGLILLPFFYSYFDITNIPSYAERALASRVERLANPASGIKEIFTVYLPVTLILVATILLFFRSDKKIIKILATFIFLLYVFRNTLAGWRSLVVTPVMLAVIYYHYRIKRLTLWLLLIVGISLYIFMNVLSFARVTSDPKEMVEIIANEFSENIVERLNIVSSSELQVGSNLMRLIEGIDKGEASYSWGTSILTEILVFVPKALMPNRPLPLGEKYVEIFHPGELLEGAGYGMFIVQEGYWALGIFGVLLFMFIYGWIVEKIYQLFINNMGYDAAVFCYGMVYLSLVLFAVRSGIILNFKTAIMNCLPLILILVLPSFFRGRSLKNNHRPM